MSSPSLHHLGKRLELFSKNLSELASFICIKNNAIHKMPNGIAHDKKSRFERQVPIGKNKVDRKFLQVEKVKRFSPYDSQGNNMLLADEDNPLEMPIQVLEGLKNGLW